MKTKKGSRSIWVLFVIRRAYRLVLAIANLCMKFEYRNVLKIGRTMQNLQIRMEDCLVVIQAYHLCQHWIDRLHIYSVIILQ